MEQYFLANYMRMHITETFLAPGKSVALQPNINYSMSNVASQYLVILKSIKFDYNNFTLTQIDTHCSLKGAQMLHSLETIGNRTKEANFLKKFRHIIKYQRYKSFSIDNLLELLRSNIVDSIDLAQVFFCNK